jgi:hypothetical protein
MKNAAEAEGVYVASDLKDADKESLLRICYGSSSSPLVQINRMKYLLGISGGNFVVEEEEIDIPEAFRLLTDISLSFPSDKVDSATNFIAYNDDWFGYRI